LSIPKKRDTTVKVWLLLMVVVNVAVILLYAFLAASPVLSSFFLSKYPFWLVYMFSAFAAVNVACVGFLFLWKKWAFYVLCGSAAATLAINLYIGVGVQAFLGLGEVAITYLVIHQQWNLFD